MLNEKFIFGAAVGSGLTAQSVDKVGVDFIIVLNAGRLRMQGVSSLNCFLPLHCANDLVFKIAQEEILHRCSSPVLAGLSVSDPNIDTIQLANKTKDFGFSGICNFPSSALLDGRVRQLMDSEGLGFKKECALINAAAKLNLKTFAYVSTNEEAKMMVDAGADMVCVVFGFTSGATGIANSETLETTAELANRVLSGVPTSTGKLIEGGAITSPEDALKVSQLSRVNGYVAGSTIDRLPLQKTIEEVAQSYTVISQLKRHVTSDLNQTSTLIGSSMLMQNLRRDIAEIAPSELSVFITGETGTGKSKIANDIHIKSDVSTRPPIIVDCNSLLAEYASEQFMGQVPNMPRANIPQTRGILESANNNSLILEEVSVLNAETQGQLLRFAETGYVQRLGTIDGRNVKVRLIVTSSLTPTKIEDNTVLRQDLFQRINQFQINLPTLKEHRDDIPELIRYFAELLSGRDDIQFTNSAIRTFIEYDWPGNIRELKTTIQRILVLNSSGRVKAKDVEFIKGKTINKKVSSPFISTKDEPQNEQEWILQALRLHNFRKGDTAVYLGVSARTLYNKMKKFKLL